MPSLHTCWFELLDLSTSSSTITAIGVHNDLTSNRAFRRSSILVAPRAEVVTEPSLSYPFFASATTSQASHSGYRFVNRSA